MCVVAMAACAAPAPTMGTAADETAVRGVASKYADAFNRNDVASLVAMFTDDYESVGPDGTVVKGKAQLEEMEKAGAAQRAGLPLKLIATTSFVKWASATTAVAGGPWTMEGLPAGAPNKGAWNGMFVKGADGEWRMSTGLVAEFVPPPAPPTDGKD
jgi:uncharacterized protein (TIGR02246 family)